MAHPDFPCSTELQFQVNMYEPSEALGAVHNAMASAIQDMADDRLLGLRDDDLLERTEGALHHIRCAVELLSPGMIDQLELVKATLETLHRNIVDRDAAAIMHL